MIQRQPDTPELREARRVRADIDRLLLITEALWTLMKQNHHLTDNTLIQLVQQLDQHRTPSPSGVTSTVALSVCPSCGRLNIANRDFCISCGTRLPRLG